mmetsp:Transcript_15908/g.37601  ORF Transcript_15908/g.37601 Transcript_15908/m.37601 type:complete len:81 (-) Transcript_15908:13-255(-)
MPAGSPGNPGSGGKPPKLTAGMPGRAGAAMPAGTPGKPLTSPGAAMPGNCMDAVQALQAPPVTESYAVKNGPAQRLQSLN